MIEIKTIVEGGKATPKPPLGPQLAAAKLDIKKAINKINEKTKEFEGMEVPVTIKIDPKTKEIEVVVSTPSVASLVKKELNVKKLAKTPFTVYEEEEIKEEFKESLKFEQVVKIAKMKMESMKTDDLKNAVKQVVGFCVSGGVYINDKTPKEILEEIKEGKWDEKIQ